MTRNWAAVATVIDEHMTELGLNQRELADRSGVALSIVKELRHNTVQRRRSGRTLEALSRALDLHPRHLSHILIGHQPPDATVSRIDDIPYQLTRIQDHLNELTDRIHAIDTKLTRILPTCDRPVTTTNPAPLAVGGPGATQEATWV